MNTQPVFLIADTHICPNNAIAATRQPPRLRALSTFSRPVDETALKLISLPPPLTHTLTIVTFSGKANWGNISASRLGQNIPVLNAIPMKYQPRSPRAARHAHANRHASWSPNSDILPRGFSRCTTAFHPFSCDRRAFQARLRGQGNSVSEPNSIVPRKILSSFWVLRGRITVGARPRLPCDYPIFSQNTTLFLLDPGEAFQRTSGQGGSAADVLIRNLRGEVSAATGAADPNP